MSLYAVSPVIDGTVRVALFRCGRPRGSSVRIASIDVIEQRIAALTHKCVVHREGSFDREIGAGLAETSIVGDHSDRVRNARASSVEIQTSPRGGEVGLTPLGP